MEYVNWVIENWDVVFSVATSVIGVAAVIAAATGSESDDKWVAQAKKVLNIVAMNVAKAKNKDAE